MSTSPKKTRPQAVFCSPTHSRKVRDPPSLQVKRGDEGWAPDHPGKGLTREDKGLTSEKGLTVCYHVSLISDEKQGRGGAPKPNQKKEQMPSAPTSRSSSSHKPECHSAFKKNGIPTLATARVNLDDTVFSEMSRSQKGQSRGPTHARKRLPLPLVKGCLQTEAQPGFSETGQGGANGPGHRRCGPTGRTEPHGERGIPPTPLGSPALGRVRSRACPSSERSADGTLQVSSVQRKSLRPYISPDLPRPQDPVVETGHRPAARSRRGQSEGPVVHPSRPWTASTPCAYCAPGPGWAQRCSGASAGSGPCHTLTHRPVRGRVTSGHCGQSQPSVKKEPLCREGPGVRMTTDEAACWPAPQGPSEPDPAVVTFNDEESDGQSHAFSPGARYPRAFVRLDFQGPHVQLATVREPGSPRTPARCSEEAGAGRWRVGRLVAPPVWAVNADVCVMPPRVLSGDTWGEPPQGHTAHRESPGDKSAFSPQVPAEDNSTEPLGPPLAPLCTEEESRGLWGAAVADGERSPSPNGALAPTAREPGPHSALGQDDTLWEDPPRSLEVPPAKGATAGEACRGSALGSGQQSAVRRPGGRVQPLPKNSCTFRASPFPSASTEGALLVRPPQGGDDVTLKAAGRDMGQQRPEGREGLTVGGEDPPHTPLLGKVAAPQLDNTPAGTSCTREGPEPPRADPRPAPRGARRPLIPKFAPSHTHSQATPASPQPLPLCSRRVRFPFLLENLVSAPERRPDRVPPDGPPVAPAPPRQVAALVHHPPAAEAPLPPHPGPATCVDEGTPALACSWPCHPPPGGSLRPPGTVAGQPSSQFQAEGIGRNPSLPCTGHRNAETLASGEQTGVRKGAPPPSEPARR
ncbi:collagen alpha-1(I) chain-like [Muntiacus reevesi]|uniref:collagen alpha-1(I) chain-like n=1 Tax=Muntiacus reevesi TaxID=9886 RepID=UPI00330718B4